MLLRYEYLSGKIQMSVFMMLTAWFDNWGLIKIDQSHVWRGETAVIFLACCHSVVQTACCSVQDSDEQLYQK